MKIAVALMSSALLVSCGAFEKSKKQVKKVSRSDPELVGTWNTDCTESSALDLTHGQKEVIFDLAGSFKKKEYLYDNEGCMNKSATYEVEGDYKDTGKNETNPDIKNIDFKPMTANFTLHSDALVKAMNLAKFCGISDWKKDSKRDVLGRDCMGYSVPKKEEKVLDVYNIKDRKELYFGGNFLFLSENDPSKRPEDIDPDLLYSKK
ncbi:MAG: hypothetical protein AB7T49_03870 [Oligoflexales bacterium]